MPAIRGTWINGQIIPDEPVSWPEGCRLTIDAVKPPFPVGMTEDEQGSDPAAIARWIEAFDAIPPVELSPAEEAAWQCARLAQRAT